MTFALDNIIGAYKDFARSYLFYARVFFGASGTLAGGWDSNYRYLVQSTTLPKQTLESVDVNYQGMKWELPTTQTFDNFDITFKADPNQDLRTRFLRWMSLIHEPTTNIHLAGATGAGPAQYLGKVHLSQLNGGGVPIMNYELINAWPKSVGEITLDYGNKEVSTFTVSFSYQYHIVSKIAGGVVDVSTGRTAGFAGF